MARSSRPHSNCRAIVATDRQISDDMIREIARRGGVIGINFYDRFLLQVRVRQAPATLEDVVKHVRHICDLTGTASHVAIGTDMDGDWDANRFRWKFRLARICRS